jgi:hypothetical protein
MKPRLEPVPHTREDEEVGVQRLMRAGADFRRVRFCQDTGLYQDTRDAELMLRLSSPCPSCGSGNWKPFIYGEVYGAPTDVWRRCIDCGNIRSASSVVADITNCA